uniref:Uncharacterized protein n=1 Tax=Caenorhabditis japonica TaxID=281687 RepID=A0A8R1DM68_CAEJA
MNTDKDYTTPSRHNRMLKKRNNPFYYKHPTDHLPNFVYDNFCKKMMGKSLEDNDDDNQKSLSKTSRKRIEDWWKGKSAENLTTALRRRLPSVSEFGESACSKVLSEEERNALRSPRKMVLKSYPSENSTPIAISCNTVTPKTTFNRKSVQQTPAKPSGNRPTSRNLLHYFKSNTAL